LKKEKIIQNGLLINEEKYFFKKNFPKK
jgi:hypothetical protein